MKNFIILIAIFLPTLALCQSTQDLDNKNGYKDLTFDLPLDTVIKKANAKKFPLISTKEFTYFTIRNSDYRRFGDHTAQVYVLEYNNSKRVYGFNFWIDKKSETEFKDLLSFFTALYGEPTSKDNLGYEYEWKGAKVELHLTFDYTDESSIVYIINLEVANQAESDKADEIEKTKKDF